MYSPNNEILVESKAARDQQMAEVSDERAKNVLSQSKAIVFATWRGEGVATTEQMAEFYKVAANTVRSAASRHKSELKSDGWREVKGNDLKFLSSIGSDALQLPSSTTRLAVWTPRSALRLGMLLRDSDIARQVRTLLIDIAVQSVEERKPQRELELRVELQKLENEFQRTGWEIIQATSPRMLAFIRGELPLERTEIQYVERQTGKLIGTTTNHRILPQLVEDVGLERNSDEDREQVKDILKYQLGMDFETGEGLGEGFMIARPLVIPEDRYEECLYAVAVELYGRDQLVGWDHDQQLLPNYLGEQGLLSSNEDVE